VVKLCRGRLGAAGVASCALALPALAGDFALYGSQTSGNFNTWGLIRFEDPIDGSSYRIGGGGVLAFDFDFDAHGVLYAPGGGLNIIDTEDGSEQYIGDWGLGNKFISSLAFAPDGTLYGTDNEGPATSLYTIDPETAKATVVGPVGEFVFGLDFGRDGTLYGASGEIFTIDVETGAKDKELFGFGPFITALDYGADGVLRGIETDFDTFDSLWEIDVEALELHLVGMTDEADVGGLGSVPAPGTVVLVLSIAAAASRRRRDP
jgi:hypothetical protein